MGGHVQNEQKRCEELGINWRLQPRVMNIERSSNWGSQSQTISPTLLTGVSRGFWLLSRGRRLTGPETLRLQGIPTELYKWPTNENTQRRQAGNAICVSVLTEIVKALYDHEAISEDENEPQLRHYFEANSNKTRTASEKHKPKQQA